MVFHGKWYDEVNVGESFGTSVTVTETHIVLGSGMFGDFNPLHVDEEFSKKSMFGGRILHGPFTSALVASPVGIYFAGTAIAYLEHSCRFKAPVRAGDTIATRWTVTAKSDKPRHKGGIIERPRQRWTSSACAAPTPASWSFAIARCPPPGCWARSTKAPRS